MGLTVPVDFSTSGLGLVGSDHDKGPNSSRYVLLKHFAARARGAPHCKQDQVLELDTCPGSWENWAQDFATVQSYELPESIPYFPLPVFPHFSVSPADDISKEILGDLLAVHKKAQEACSVLHATATKKSLKWSNHLWRCSKNV